MMLLGALLIYTKFSYISSFCEERHQEKILAIANNISYVNKQFAYNGLIEDCECEKSTCVRKCCDANYVPFNDSCVPALEGARFQIYNQSKPVEGDLNVRIISGYINCKGNPHYMLQESEGPDDEFFIQKDGLLWHPSEGLMVALDSYCVDDFDGDRTALICFPEKNPNTVINITGMVISMPFLLATFLIYALMPDLNMHNKSLMCYVLSLLLAYIWITLINSVALEGLGCTAMTLCCLYFFTASFFWMNVMSIDIWRTFSGKRDISGNTKEHARKLFLIYNAYAWGVPFVLVSLVVILNECTSKENWYHPSIGQGLCWFYESIPELLYFYGPMALIIVLNLVLFGVTALKIRKMQKDTQMLRSGQYKKHSEDEQRQFKLYIRLFLAMGVNWIMEIVSWTVNWKVGSIPRSVWYLTDFCNAAYGVVIFFIFVFKKRIWKTLRTRYPCGSKQSCKDESDLTATL
ncbi:G-protein coupled receptor Mth2-like [Photinus pyralis]|nr:G-protein coupled receptor Mth2-like [Photinus pyralis]